MEELNFILVPAVIFFIGYYIAGFTKFFGLKVKRKFNNYLIAAATGAIVEGLMLLYQTHTTLARLYQTVDVGINFSYIYFWLFLTLLSSLAFFYLSKRTKDWTKSSTINFFIVSTLTLILELLCLYIFKVVFLDQIANLYQMTINYQ